jgi:hypothetical protein
MGSSKVKPIVMRDTGFWTGDYSAIISAVAATGSRNWTTPQTGGDKVTSGVLGITSEDWTDIRGPKYRNTEMIGAMVAKLSYGEATDYIVSAAPNLLYASNTSEYKDHTAGDNKGTQIHSEMIMGEQLTALVKAMQATPETPLGAGRARPGLSHGTLTIDADMFIEKGSMCDACRGTWNKLIQAYAGSTYRIA